MNINTYLHKYLKNWLTKEMVVADCTMGNGNDTLFLAMHAKYVYAFDIQKEALLKTESKTQGYQNINLILDSHEKIDSYIKEPLDCIIFNLGYLPNANSSIKTSSHTSKIAVLKAYKLLKKNGLLAISIYRGHPGALNEYHSLLKLFEDESFKVLEKYHEYKHQFEPILYIIQK